MWRLNQLEKLRELEPNIVDGPFNCSLEKEIDIL
jgi:hypothetical protein